MKVRRLNTNIGSDSGGVTALLGNLEVGSNGAGTINLWRPITPKYTPSAIVSGHIGYVILYNLPALNDITSTLLATVEIPTGVWIININYTLSAVNRPLVGANINCTRNSTGYSGYFFSDIYNEFRTFSINTTLVVTSASDNLKFYAGCASGSFNTISGETLSYIRATRIA